MPTKSDCPCFLESHAVQTLNWSSHCNRTDASEKRIHIKLARVTAGSQQQDNGKHKDVTVCSKKEEDAATSNTHMVTGQFAFYDVSTHQTTDATTAITPYDMRTTATTAAAKSKEKTASAAERKKEQGQDTELTFDVIQRTPDRCATNDSVQELLNGTEGSRWDAILQCETWRKAKSETLWRHDVTTFFVLWRW